MAIAAATGTVAAIGGLKVSDVANMIEVGMDMDTVDSTTFGSGQFKSYVAGIKALKVAISGFNDYNGATSADTLLTSYFGGTYTATVCPVGDTTTSVATIGRGLLTVMRPFSG